MNTIVITNLNDGINVKADPSAISEGGLQDCIGFDLTTEGILNTANGLATNDISTLLPTNPIQCYAINYIGLTKYVLATTGTGLYANGVLVRAGFTGRFKSVSFLNNIYLVNGLQAVRFDGTTCYQWGITAPTSMPTIVAGTYLYTTIDTFESLATWIANAVSCTVAAEAVIKKEDTQSIKITVATDTTGYSYVPATLDLTHFSDGSDSTVDDYIRFWSYIDNLINLDSLSLFVDVGDGTFINDYFSYSIVSPGLDSGLQSLGLGATADVITQDSVTNNTGGYWSDIPGEPIVNSETGVITYPQVWVPATSTVTITKSVTKTVVDPTVTDQLLSFWNRSNLIKVKSGVWQEIKIPKSLFTQNGDGSKDWSTVAAVKLEIKASSKGSVNVYFDGLKLVGGSSLIGDYWFMYSWVRTDGSGNIQHTSSPSRTAKQVNIIGPINFDRHPLTYSARPLSTDPQVNGGLISCIGGMLSDFYELALIEDNTTVTDTLYNIGDSVVNKILYSKQNEPAPPGTDLVVHQGKIWMIGDPSYPQLIRSSDILADGTLAPEGWPTRNAYEPENNNGKLLNIRLVNKIPVVKGESGEWVLQILDPTDFLQVKARQTSTMGILGMDSVIDFETSNVYPSINGFVESDGNQSRFILPEIQPLIDDNISSAIGVNAGLISYFTYETALYGTRTAKIDLFRGKPRFANINSYRFEWLDYDKRTNKVYALKDGVVYILDQGMNDVSIPSGEIRGLIKSRVYRPGNKLSWSRVELIHNTGGVWYRLEVYIDGIFISSTPFKSTTRTVSDFRDFGPISGYDFQFVIQCDFNAPGIIYFPIRIYYGGK